MSRILALIASIVLWALGAAMRDDTVNKRRAVIKRGGGQIIRISGRYVQQSRIDAKYNSFFTMVRNDFEDSNWVQDLSWPAVEQRLANGAGALLPIGAASKEHGPHLPHGTDYLQVLCYADRIAETVDVLIWPVATYGYYPVFTDYPGSVSLASETFQTIIAEILDGIVQAGAARIVLLNTGISTIEPLERLLEERPSEPKIKLVNCYAGPRFICVSRDIEEQAFGGHADEIETALMLAIDPARVAIDRARASEVHIKRGMFNRTDPKLPNYSPTGVNGDPTRATVAKGDQLLAALIEDLVEEVGEFARS